MVDCSLYNLGKITNEERVRILNYVMEEKGVRARDLGVTINYISMIRSGKKRVTEELLCRAMAYLSPDELAKLLGGAPEFERATMNDIIKVIATARADPDFRDALFSYLERYLGEYLRSVSRRWAVTESDIQEFIKAKRLRGVSEKTLNDELRYIRRALAELNWVLSPEGIREYLAELSEESPYVLKHTTYSLKSFLKEVLQPRDPWLFAILYYSFRTSKPKNRIKVKLPTIDELKQILAKIESIEAKTYFLILAETGLRPSEPFLVSMDDVDFEHGMLRIGKITETKRAFIAFLRQETLEFIKSQYLPRRDWLIRNRLAGIKADYLGVKPNAEDWARRFIPFDRDRLRREIKEAARQVLGREFELYELRKFFATWMVSHGVPESIVNTLQGRAPPSEYRVLIEHYWSPRHEELRKWYLEHAPCLLCQ